MSVARRQMGFGWLIFTLSAMVFYFLLCYEGLSAEKAGAWRSEHACQQLRDTMAKSSLRSKVSLGSQVGETCSLAARLSSEAARHPPNS